MYYKITFIAKNGEIIEDETQAMGMLNALIYFKEKHDKNIQLIKSITHES